MGRRRLIMLLALAALFVCVSGSLYAVAHPAPPDADRGVLQAAVQNANSNKGAPATRIATDPAHQAVVESGDVLWYDQAGGQHVTVTNSNFDVILLFQQNNFANWRQDFSPAWTTVVGQIVPPLLFIGILVWVFRQMRGGMGGIGKSKAKQVLAETSTVTFADVAGCDEAVQELGEVVACMTKPEKFTQLGARTPRGVLLVGPPGTGKTLLARAVAGECGVPFFSASGSEFVEMFVGVGAARVRDLFAQARRAGKGIIFIDEIDAVGRKRGGGTGHSNDEREQTLNQLLVEMDGFDNASPIIVIAATNRSDVLDQALLRPGRFDRQVTVDTPDLKGRTEILHVHARGKPLAADVDLHTLAKQTPGFSGADLANIINESALLAARRDGDSICMKDLEDAMLRVAAGPERINSLMSEREKEIVAYHEMGHALVGHVLEHSDPVYKISIVSRGRALGWTMQLPDRDRVLTSRNQLTDRLAGLLGGRCAEELVFGADEITTGAADDIERATRLAHDMVTRVGMSPLGWRAFFEAEPGSPRTYSEATALQIDAEVDRLLDEAAERARQVLRSRRDVLEALAQRLLEVETMDSAEMGSIVDSFPGKAAPRPSVVVSLPRRSADEPVAVAPPEPVSTGRWLLPQTVSAAVQPRRRMGLRRTAAMLLRLANATVDGE